MKDDGLFAMAGLDTGFGREGGRSFHLAYLPELNCRASTGGLTRSGLSEGYLGSAHEVRICVRLPDPDSAICNPRPFGHGSVVSSPGEDLRITMATEAAKF